MKTSLARTLIIAFLLVALSAVGILFISIRLSSPVRLNQLIQDQNRSAFKAVLLDYYEQNQSWVGLEDYLRSQDLFSLGEPQSPPMALPEAKNPFPERYRRQYFGLADSSGVSVLRTPQYLVGAKIPQDVLKKSDPVERNGEVIGYILPIQQPIELTLEEKGYLQQTTLALSLSAVVAILVALALAIILSRQLTRPLRDLTGAVERMRSGELEQEVQVTSQDEIGKLAEAVNQMSREVSQANRLRRQMTADIAHDLRTPLTVIAGYLEAMQDGVLQPTPERISVIYADVQHLQRLVNDLRTLSQADAGELPLYKQAVTPGVLLGQCAATYYHQSQQLQINLQVIAAPDVPKILVDEGRMFQVLSNLIANALRYTPAGGEIVLSAEVQAGEVVLSVQDNGSGIAPEDLPFIFNRFYRADRMRHEEDNSGLGLAIVKSLVEAQGGRVQAESEPGQGTRILILFPAFKTS